MNRFAGPLGVVDTGDSDVEALQTDVMRFLSIIALCLLAVFAAVSSEPPPAVKEMIKVQEAAIESLQQTLDSTTESYNEKLSQLTAENNQLKMTTAQPEPIPQEPFQEQLQSLEKQRDAMKAEVSELNAALDMSETHNRKLESLVDMLQATPTDEQSEPLKQEPVELQEEPEIVAPTPEPQEEKGFTLAFASDEVLLQLVGNGRVDLFAKAANQVWQFNTAGNRFIQVASVTEFFELGAVPSKIKQLAQRQLNSSTIEWGVSFDKVLRASLNKVFAEKTSGDIIVQENGGLAIANPE